GFVLKFGACICGRGYPRRYHVPAAPLAGAVGGGWPKTLKTLPRRPPWQCKRPCRLYCMAANFAGAPGCMGLGQLARWSAFVLNTKPRKTRRQNPGRPRPGHDPMVGVRLPRKMLKKIAKVADALSADRSTAIRSILEAGLDSGMMIGLLRSGKSRGWTGEIA